MSTAEERLAAKAKRMNERKASVEQAAAAHTAPPATTVETPLARPVRTTLDLSPARDRDLKAWLAEASVRLGRARVTKQDALNALVALLLTDETLAKKILAELKNQ
jgi:hypothetical protein